MLPDSQEYLEALELCKKVASIDLPSEPSDGEGPMALVGAMAVRLPAALGTIESLKHQTEVLRSSVKVAITMVADARATIDHYIEDWHRRENGPTNG